MSIMHNFHKHTIYKNNNIYKIDENVADEKLENTIKTDINTTSLCMLWIYKHTRRVLSIYEFQIYEYMIFVNVHIMYRSLHLVYKNVNENIKNSVITKNMPRLFVKHTGLTPMRHIYIAE